MNNLPLSRLLAGVGIIAIGVASLLGSFDVINFSEIARNYWPILFIAAGVLLLIDNARQNYLWSVVLIILGAVMQLNVLDITDINFWQLFWPLILIAFGWSLISQRTRLNPSSTDKISAILAGVETKIDSKNFKGSRATAIFGGGSIDLRKADFKKEATIEVLAVAGGIELRVPESWEVRVSVMSILGGVENKTQAHSKSSGPILNVVGTTLLGGVEIKN